MPPDPDRIGPYRLERRLGAGGMGEVYLAYDEQLERRVAVKYIRPEAAGRPEARQRFRREAKAAAALSHPATVQIFHVLETAGGDAIVMEFIEGETLAVLLHRKRLPLRRALRLGREITSGLAAAHARGILHRDLKPENVMVTEVGHAKILDFGLAKSLDPRDDTEPLSHGGGVLGTYAAMSPEQARGQDLDVRSDLFALGILLYRMVTGHHPFAAGNPVDMLTRICTQQQISASDVVSDLPRDLSALLDHMLEKDPPRRPESAHAVLAELQRISSLTPLSSDESDSGIRALEAIADDAQRWAIDQPTWDANQATLVGAGSPSSTTVIFHSKTEPRQERPAWKRPVVWMLAALLAALLTGTGAWWLHREAPPPLYVAVLPPEVTTQATLGEEAQLASSLELALLRNLLGREGLAVLPPEQMGDLEGTPLEIARSTAADEVFTSQLHCPTASCNLVLRRISGYDGSLLWTERLAVLRERPRALPEVLESYLQLAYPSHPARTRQPGLLVSEPDYEEFLELYTRFTELEGSALSIDRVLERLAGIRRRSPRFVEAYLLDAQLRLYRFNERRDASDLDVALELLEQAEELAPGDPRPLMVRFDVGLKAEQTAVAEQSLEQLARLQPGDSQTLMRRASLYQHQGRSAQAIRWMRQAVQQQPSRHHLFKLAQLEMALGEYAAARAHLDELLRRSPGYYAAQSLLAQLEMTFGSLERALELYQQLVESSPQMTELTNLSITFMLLDRWQEAEQVARRALAREPNNPMVALNLADTLEHLGRHPEARLFYERVVTSVARDPAASHWQMLTVKAQALAHLGRGSEARAAVELALQRAPRATQVAFEAALVYTLVGEYELAREHAQRALEDFDVRWFSLPWFDPLREQGIETLQAEN